MSTVSAAGQEFIYSGTSDNVRTDARDQRGILHSTFPQKCTAPVLIAAERRHLTDSTSAEGCSLKRRGLTLVRPSTIFALGGSNLSHPRHVRTESQFGRTEKLG